MKKHLITAVLYTIVTTVLLGLVYPLAITLLANGIAHDKANGQIVLSGGKPVGSKLIAQAFSSDGDFHPRPSAAGANGYDAANSSGSNYGPTNQRLLDRVNGDVAAAKKQNPNVPVPIDMVTTSGSGLDPDITIANAEFQAARISRARHIPIEQVMTLIREHTTPRQFKVFGEPRVNVFQLNLALESLQP